MSDVSTETQVQEQAVETQSQEQPQSVHISQFIDGENLKDGWQDALGDDFKGNKTLQNFKSIPGLAKSYVNLRKMVGENVVKAPTEKSGPEELDAFFKAAGMPETAEEYGLDPIDDLPEGIEWNKDSAMQFNEIARQLRLTKPQRDALIRFDSQRMAESMGSTKTLNSLEGYTGNAIKSLLQGDENYQGFVQQNKQEMERQLGQQGLSMAKRAAIHLGMEDMINDPILGNSPKFMEGMKKVAELLGENRLPSNDAELGFTDLGSEIKKFTTPGTQEYADYNSPVRSVSKAAADRMFKLIQLKQSKEQS